jgi:rRNA-processing protein FCF1
VAEANFLEGRLLVPQFVLAELQRVADAEDPLKRRRGRRGLEMLDRLVGESRIPTEVVHDDPEAGTVDDKLVRVCLARQADLVTTDYNLHRVASLQGVRVLNLHQLANVVKAPYLPGERLSLTVAREGREPGQGLAYLEDGTMVVVEDAAHLVGSTVDAVVTSSLQTQMGRMIFARPADAERRAGRDRCHRLTLVRPPRNLTRAWGLSSAGRAVALQAIGRRFESGRLHHAVPCCHRRGSGRTRLGPRRLRWAVTGSHRARPGRTSPGGAARGRGMVRDTASYRSRRRPGWRALCSGAPPTLRGGHFCPPS